MQLYDYLQLRELAASYMLEHKEEFIPFMDEDVLAGSFEVILTTRSNFVNLKWHRS